MDTQKILSLDIFQTLVDVNARIPHIWKNLMQENYTKEGAYQKAKELLSYYPPALEMALGKKDSFMTMYDVFMVCGRNVVEKERLSLKPEQIVDNLMMNHGLAPYYTEVWEAMEQLKARYRIIISSDSSHSMADPIIEKIQPEKAYISDDLECYKGDRLGRFFKKVLEDLQVPANQVIHVGDSSSDVLGAKAVGITAVWLNRDNRQWSHNVQPDYEIHSLLELVSL